MAREAMNASQEPGADAGSAGSQPGDGSAHAGHSPITSGGRARRPSSHMPSNSLFYERIVPLLLIVLLIAVAALVVFIVWGVAAGTYA